MLLHPQFLWGLTGAAVPVLVHLLARRRAKRVPFPSLRLLRAAEKKRRTFARLQRPLSLLLRVLAVALIALALAAPVAGPLPSWLPVSRSRAVAVVLDDTLSMTAPAEGHTPFERARESADRFLSALAPTDRVCLIRVSAPEAARWARPREAREWLRREQPTASGAKLGPALFRAVEALEEITAPNRALLLVTDLQAAAWHDPPVRAEELRGTPIALVDVGDERALNVAVTDAEVLTPTVVIGRPVRLQVSAAAFSAGKVARKPMKVVLQLLVGGRPLAASEQEVSLEAPAVAQFSFVPEKPEDIVARVGLTGGPFGPGADDVRYCTVRVRSPIRVLVAAGGNVGRYVVTALDPYGEPSRSGIDVRAVGPGDLGEAVASGTPDLVVLANCPGLDESARQALAMLASSGGGILVFLGDAADTGYVANELVPRVVGDRSLTFGPMEGAPPGAPFGLTEIDTARPPLQAFANPRAGDLGALRFAKARKINVGDEARVLAAYDNGSPALLEWRAGAGRLMLFNTSADGSWGEHIRSPAYVPLMHRLAGYLARPGRPSIADVVVGEKPAIARAAPPPTEVRLQSPGGEEQTVPVQDGMLSEVKVPGEYPVRCGDLDLAFAANVDPRESDLTRTDRAFVEKALAPAKVTFLPPSAVAEEFRAALPASTELSVPLLLLALAAVLVESVLSIIRRGPEEGAGKARASAV